MRFLTCRLIVAAGVACSTLAFGSPSTQVSFRSKVEAVRVPATVDYRGKPVIGLTANEFELLDNGVPQTVELVDRHEVGLDIVFALDTSTSVWRGHLDQPLRNAALAALGELRTVDRAGLVFFSHRVYLESPLTNELAIVKERMYGSRQDGATALYDAVVAAIIAAEPQALRRTLLIVYTDGNDTISWHSPADALSTAARSEVVVYAVVPSEDRSLRVPSRFSEYATTWDFLRELTTRTGGKAIPVRSAQLGESFQAIVREFAQGYQLLFYPKAVEKGGWHSLSVKLHRRAGSVKARRGYYAD